MGAGGRMTADNPTVAEIRERPEYTQYRICPHCSKFAACEYLPSIEINGVPVANKFPLICAKCKRGLIIDWLAEHKGKGGVR